MLGIEDTPGKGGCWALAIVFSISLLDCSWLLALGSWLLFPDLGQWIWRGYFQSDSKTFHTDLDFLWLRGEGCLENFCFTLTLQMSQMEHRKTRRWFSQSQWDTSANEKQKMGSCNWKSSTSPGTLYSINSNSLYLMGPCLPGPPWGQLSAQKTEVFCTEMRNDTQERSLYVTLLVCHMHMLAQLIFQKTYKCFSSELRGLMQNAFSTG